MNEGLHIFRKAEAAKPESGAKELAANPRIQSHCMSNLFYVCADSFTKIGDDVGVADLQREKRVRCMLDELGAVDGGDQKCRFVLRWAIAFVNRTMKFALEDRPVDFAQIGRGGFAFDTDHDAVGMKEIFNRCAFAQKFRI